MLNRYIGNKRAILQEILDVIAPYARPGALVCDAFSGSLAVSLALKSSGYRVAANDINLFSAIYGHAYLTNDAVPPIDFDMLLPNDGHVRLLLRAEKTLDEYRGEPGYEYLSDPAFAEDAHRLLAIMLHLQDGPDAGELPADFRRSDIFDHYCEAGRLSAFQSSRGRRGRRRFFSSENAKHLDAILNRLRYWNQLRLIDETTQAVLLTILLEATERVANTQGTYHDFPRDTYDPRALKPLRLEMPRFDGLLDSGLNHMLGVEKDSLDFVQNVPSHDVLYIDPPYNFRQYSAYYFLPNLICRYPTLRDPDGYFSQIRYVRGQNSDDNFTSTFSSARTFLPSLEELIVRARARTVVMSYFDGRNHWNDFKSEANGEGYRRLESFFKSDLFASESFAVVPVSRLNYQSYGGFKARDVVEYIFVAEKH